MTWPVPVIYFGVSEADYHAIGHEVALSKSLLWDFYPSPWAWARREPKKATEAMVWGSLVDCLLLQPDQFNACFAVSPFDSFQTKEARIWRDAQSLPIITRDTLQEAWRAVKVLEENGRVNAIISQSKPQVSVFANVQFPDIGTPYGAKCRIDLLPFSEGEKIIWDLKTVASLSRLEWTILDRGYHVQAAWYLDLYNLASGDDRDSFGFIFQESKPPYEIALVELDSDAIAAGREWYVKAVQRWHECQTTGIYPSPTAETVRVISLPKRYEP